jgi:hypothetical protein
MQPLTITPPAGTGYANFSYAVQRYWDCKWIFTLMFLADLLGSYPESPLGVDELEAGPLARSQLKYWELVLAHHGTVQEQ